MGGRSCAGVPGTGYGIGLPSGGGRVRFRHGRLATAEELSILSPELPDATGRRRVYERARYIPDPTNFRKYYRHLLAGPYRIYRAYAASSRRVWPLLCGPLDRPGEIVEQLCAYQEMVTNAGLMAAVTAMYIDPETDRPKRGTMGKGPGSPRRLPKVINQFDVTWDLYSMTPAQILGMLPPEFDRWKPWNLHLAGVE